MLLLTWCACYFPKIIILRFEVISEKIRKNPVNTEKTFSMYYSGRLRARSGRERDTDLSRLAEFQTPTILDHNFDFHRSISYSDPKIVKIIIYIL